MAASQEADTASTLELVELFLEKEASSEAIAAVRSKRLADVVLLFQAMGG